MHYINVLQSLHRLITSCVAYFQITNRTDKIAGSRILNKQDQGEPYHLIRGFSSHLYEFCLAVRYSDGIDHGRVNATVVSLLIMIFIFLSLLLVAYINDLNRLEKERNIRPSPEIDAFMKVVILNLCFHFCVYVNSCFLNLSIFVCRHRLSVVRNTVFQQIMS